MSFIKKLIPSVVLKAIRPFYHGVVAHIANFYFGRPSEKMVVIGITGTTGKSSTVAMLAHILNHNGKQCGFSTTVNFSNGKKTFMNKRGLSMPGGWELQKRLKDMLDSGCKYAIVECTSEGLAQNRHFGTNFDVAVFTNLSHAHLEAHGSFGNYKQAKSKLFNLNRLPKKSFFPKKAIGVNIDDPISGFFLGFAADEKFGVSFNAIETRIAQKVFFGNVLKNDSPLEFELAGVKFILNLLGGFNIKNASLAAACANILGIELGDASKALESFTGIAGRMEKVPNNLGLEIIVDYGCEPASIKAALEEASILPRNKLIHAFGSTGGHRDISKQFEFGKTSAQYADHIIVTNDDVYDSDPNVIAQNIVEGINSFKLRKPPYEIILDRRSAIHHALKLAQKGDLLLITGKGSEQFLVLPENKRIEWEDVSVVKEELKSISG